MKKALTVLQAAKERSASERTAIEVLGASRSWETVSRRSAGRGQGEMLPALIMSLWGWTMAGFLGLVVLGLVVWIETTSRLLPADLARIQLPDRRVAIPADQVETGTDATGREWIVIGREGR